MEINWNWSKVWRIAVIIALVILAIIYCIIYFKNNSVWAGLSTILAFVVGCIGGYLVKGLKEEIKKDGI